MRPPPPLLALTAAVCVVLLVGTTWRSPSPPPPQLASRLVRTPRGAWPPPPLPSSRGWKGSPPLARKAKRWPPLVGKAKAWPPLMERHHGAQAVEALRKNLWEGGAAIPPAARAGGGEGEPPVAVGGTPHGSHVPVIPDSAAPQPATAATSDGLHGPGGARQSPAGTEERAADAPHGGIDGEAEGGGANEGATIKVLTGDSSRVAKEDAADGMAAVHEGAADVGARAAPAVDSGGTNGAVADALALGGPGPVMATQAVGGPGPAMATPAGDSGGAGVVSSMPVVDGPEPQLAVAAAAGEDIHGVGVAVGVADAGSAAGSRNSSTGGVVANVPVNLLASGAARTATAVGASAHPPTNVPPGLPIALVFCPEDWASGAVKSLAAALPGTLTAMPVAAVPAAALGGGGTSSGNPDSPVTVFVRSAWGHCAAPASAVGMVFVDMEPRAEPLVPPPGVVIVSGTDLWGGGASATGDGAAGAGVASPHLHIPYAMISLGQRVGVDALDLARQPSWVPPPPVVDGARFGVWDVEGCGPDARAAGGAAPPGDIAASVAFDVINSRYKRLTAVGGCHPPAENGHGEREAAVARLRGHKFALVAERSALPGFVSERVVDAYLAGVVPIYVGGPRDGGRFLNPGAVIRCGPGPAGDWAACLAAIAALDGDAAAHAAAVAAPLYAPGGGEEGGWARWDTHATRLVAAVRGLPGGADGAPRSASRGVPAAPAATV